jgi:hypothetical protein
MRIAAEVQDAVAVCRLLLKMGCEHLATFDPGLARGDHVAAARRFARAPKRGARWWFLLLSDPSRFAAEDETFLDVVEQDRVLVVQFHSACFDLIAPLAADVEPDPTLDTSPASRLYQVQV